MQANWYEANKKRGQKITLIDETPDEDHLIEAILHSTWFAGSIQVQLTHPDDDCPDIRLTFDGVN
jgi:hypothetical protein